MGVEVESAGDQHVEPCIYGFTGGVDNILAADGAVFRADQYGGSALYAVLAFDESSFSTDKIAGPGSKRFESYTISFGLLLYAFGLQIVNNDGGEILSCKIGAASLTVFEATKQFFLIDNDTYWKKRFSD